MDRLESLAKKRGLTVFARINFAKDAAAAGLTMLPAQLLILGSPAAGTPLMVAAPETALDLPLKVLAWQTRQTAVGSLSTRRNIYSSGTDSPRR